MKIPGDTIYSRFSEHVRNQGSRPAVLAPGKSSVSFRELGEFVEESRDALHRLGIGRASRLGILLTDRAQTAVAGLVAAATCTAVPLNPALTDTEIRSAIQDMRIDAVLVGEDTPDGQVATIRSTGSTAVLMGRSHPDSAGLFELEGESLGIAEDRSYPERDDVALVLQTSGTTAKSKIVPQTQFGRLTAARRTEIALEISPDDRCLNMMPMYHSQGASSEFLVPILCGASVAFFEFNPAQIEAAIEQYRPTWFNLVPSMHQTLLAYLGEREAVFKTTGLRFIRSSSAKLPLGLRSQIEKAYGVPIVEQYGSTESAGVANTGLPGKEYRPGSVGRPFHDAVMICDEDGNPLKPGEHGEICVGGPSVITGYENNPEANAESFRDGWYRTGDEGYFDADGFLYVTGRIRETVNRGGEKFSLSEVDEAVLGLDGIAEASAFLAPHDVLGHEVYAAVVLRPDSSPTPAQIRARLAAQLSWAKVPKRVFMVPELPKNSVGKVLRDNLAQLVDAE